MIRPHVVLEQGDDTRHPRSWFVWHLNPDDGAPAVLAQFARESDARTFMTARFGPELRLEEWMLDARP